MNSAFATRNLTFFHCLANDHAVRMTRGRCRFYLDEVRWHRLASDKSQTTHAHAAGVTEGWLVVTIGRYNQASDERWRRRWRRTQAVSDWWLYGIGSWCLSGVACPRHPIGLHTSRTSTNWTCCWWCWPTILWHLGIANIGSAEENSIEDLLSIVLLDIMTSRRLGWLLWF